MKCILNFSLFLLISTLFCACQKVINVKLNPGATEYVIEGIITDQPGYCTVSISQTKDFSADNSFVGISGATVSVENNGVVTSLSETGNGTGIYQTNAINGQPGQTYNLKVSLNGVVYTAASTMPQPVALDSIYAAKQALDTNRYIMVVYKDPPAVKNYYQWVQYVNGHKEQTVFIADDEFNDGLTINNLLNFSNDTKDPLRYIEIGDNVKIDQFCVDSAAYKYLSSLQQSASGSGNSASPANPVSNIQGGCLGYFSAQTVRSKSLTINL